MTREKRAACAAIAAIVFSIVISSFFSAATAEETGAEPKRLNFISSVYSNIYTERLVYEVFNRLGIEVSITMTDMDRGLQSANAGIYDGICNQTEDTAQHYKGLIPVPFETAKMGYFLVTRQGDAISCNTWDGLAGLRIGGLAAEQSLLANLPDGVAAYTEEPCMTTLYDSLRAGKYDAVVVIDVANNDYDMPILPSDLKVAGLLSSHSCHIYLSAHHAGLVDRVTAALQEMAQDGSLERIQTMKPSEDREEKIVLYLSSYSSEMEWEQRLLEGIGNILNQHKDIVFHNVALNAYRNTNTALLESATLRNISIEFMHSPPDAVIVSDNEAMNFLLNNYNTFLPNDIPIICCGINGTTLVTTHRFDLYSNMIAVIESISAFETVEAMLDLFPKTEQIYIINDYTLTGRRWQGEISTQLEPFADRVEIIHNENLDAEDLLAQVAGLNGNALVLCGSYFLDKDNQYFPQATMQRLLYNASPVPIFGLLDTTQPYSPLGGRYATAMAYGELAASIVVETIKTGRADQNLYITYEQGNRWIFNWDIMQKYGIATGRLPEGATVLNARSHLRESNPVLFFSVVSFSVTAFIVIALLAGFTIALKRRNKKLVVAQDTIQKSHDEIASVKNHLQTILETAPIAFSLLVDDVVMESNSHYKENIGTKIGEKNSAKYAGTRYDKIVEECKNKGFVKDISWNVTKADGEKVRYLYNIANSVYEGNAAIVMWGVEVEQLERQKDALSRAYHDILGLIEATPLPIAVIYPEEKRFLNANTSWRKLFKIPAGVEAASLKWGKGNILTPRPMDELIERAMATDDVITEEWVFETYDGEAFEAILYLEKVGFEGKDCLVVTHQDLREERARARLLQSAAEKEREANRLKSHFLMNMSHEIRTPMNAIIGITQLAKPTDTPQKLFASVEQIGQSASVLLKIINDVLDLSLIEDGKMLLSPEEVTLSQLIGELDAVVAVGMNRKAIERKVNMEGVIHDTVMIDSSRFQQVIMALASNAEKFTPEGGKITLTVTETEGPDNISTFMFSIQDTGVGIDPNKMSRLFKPFEQGDDSITRQYGGAGLGLSISKNIVEMMGGRIWAQSELGKGSTFHFTVQVPVLLTREKKATELGDAGLPLKKGAAKQEVDFTKLRILLVDDVEINRMIAAELLSELGCATESAENGRQAVEMVAKAAPGYYDLVFMDVQMPVLDGCSATKEIRALDRPDAATLPIVAMTANVMPDDIKMVMSAGMNGCVGKPIFIEQLIDTIKAQAAEKTV